MASPALRKGGAPVISALRARSHFGKLLQQIERDGGSLVIEKRGRPRAVLLSIRDYVKLAAPEPKVLTVIGEESQGKGTSALTARQIERIVKAARSQDTRQR